MYLQLTELCVYFLITVCLIHFFSLVKPTSSAVQHEITPLPKSLPFPPLLVLEACSHRNLHSVLIVFRYLLLCRSFASCPYNIHLLARPLASTCSPLGSFPLWRGPGYLLSMEFLSHLFDVPQETV